jgi:D-glycero-alpha-D-manno-heptose-7-phosphate kinase
VLTSGASLARFGELLDESWQIKQTLDGGVSNPQIAELYQRGRTAGAWGGKLLGAGAGGFLLFCVPPDKHAAMKVTFQDYYSLPIRIAAPGSRIIFGS